MCARKLKNSSYGPVTTCINADSVSYELFLFLALKLYIHLVYQFLFICYAFLLELEKACCD